MLLDLNKPNDLIKFKEQVRYLINKKSICDLTEKRNSRTNAQNSSRWLYIYMVSEILSERGEGWVPLGFDFEVPFTPDSLYEIY